jgi:hypothetical protein
MIKNTGAATTLIAIQLNIVMTKFFLSLFYHEGNNYSSQTGRISGHFFIWIKSSGAKKFF